MTNITKVDFDTVLVNHIGEFGLYQKVVFLLLGCASMTVTAHNFIHTFTGVQPKIVCIERFSQTLTASENNISTHYIPLEIINDAKNGQYRYMNITDTQNNGPNEELKNNDYSEGCFYLRHISDMENDIQGKPSKATFNISEGNETGGCLKYGFDDSVFQSTIVTEWLLVCNKRWLSAFSQSLHMMGTFMGCIILGHLTDRYGRKKILLPTTLGNSVIGLACGFAPDFWLYCTLRMLLGVAIAGQFNAAYVLALELVGPSYRQFAATCMLLCSSIGVMVLAGLAYCIREWWILQIAISLPSLVLFLIYIWIIPESPRWLLNNARTEEALNIINKMLKMNKKPAVTIEDLYKNTTKNAIFSSQNFKYSSIPVISVEHKSVNEHMLLKKDDVTKPTLLSDPNKKDRLLFVSADFNSAKAVNCSENELQNPYGNIHSQFTKSPKERAYSMIDLCRTPRIRTNAVLITVLWFTISTSYYGVSLYSSSLGGNIFLNLFLSGIVEVPASLGAVFLCHRFGRRNPLAASLVISGIILTANMFASKSVGASITLTLIGKLGISITFAVIYPFATEVFPTVIRTIGLGATSTGARVGAFTAPYVNLLGEFGKVVPLVTFGGMALLGATTVLCLPETRGQPLPETIDDAEAMTPVTLSCCKKKKSEQNKECVKDQDNCDIPELEHLKQNWDNKDGK